jgi:DNA-binding transcriptional MocR family regulator
MENTNLNIQHAQLPNKMTENSELEPKDLVIYLAIKRFDNPQHECFPSLHKICEKSGASINTVRKCIKNLIDAGYITTEKKMNRTYYYFDPYKKYECFSFEFLDNPNLSFIEKSYLIADQQYMNINSENCGIVTYTNREESKLTKIPYRTLMRINKSLKEKNYLQIVDTSAIDLETGCNKRAKIFNLKAFGQAVAYTLKNHENRIYENTQDIQMLKELNNKLQEENVQLKKNQDLMFNEITKLKETVNKETLTI